MEQPQAFPPDAGADPVSGGVLLAGAPASGRHTVAFALSSFRRTYAHVPALTASSPPPAGTELTSKEYLDELRSWAQLVCEFRTDAARCAFDRERLTALRAQGRVPVVCVDDPDLVSAFEEESVDWLPVLLWRPGPRRDRRAASFARAAQRFTLCLRSDRLTALEAARIVHLAVQAAAAP